jgi:hypothetical protein
MRVILLLFILCVSAFSVSAQLKTSTKCADFEIDVLDGKVNGIKPDVTPERIKVLLPCFTAATAAGDTSKCGITISYKDKDVTFYTDRDYVQVGPNFKGKLSIPLFGVQRNSLFKYLGQPKLTDQTWEAYQTSYGCLILYYDTAGKVNLIQFSSLGTEAVNLCQ